jgi:hypothetical protein
LSFSWRVGSFFGALTAATGVITVATVLVIIIIMVVRFQVLMVANMKIAVFWVVVSQPVVC